MSFSQLGLLHSALSKMAANERSADQNQLLQELKELISAHSIPLSRVAGSRKTSPWPSQKCPACGQPVP
jgi:hypothetical protein